VGINNLQRPKRDVILIGVEPQVVVGIVAELAAISRLDS